MSIEIDFSNIDEVMNAKSLEVFKAKERFVVAYGGGGSGKSIGITQVVLLRLLSEDKHRFLIIRKVHRTLRNSVFQTFKDIISDWKLQELFSVRESDFRISCKNGNEIIFSGVDDVEKLKSITGISSIWIEEATELVQNDFEQLNLRLRGATKYPKQIYISFNPTSSKSWLKRRFFDNTDDSSIKIIHSTYLDNKFIDNEYKQELGKLIDVDKNLYDIYVLGKWGELKGLIYRDYKLIKELPMEYEHRRYGLDFGYSNPMSLVEVRFIGNDVYIKESYYEREQTTQQLISFMNDNDISKSDIIRCDSAEPDRIKSISEAGYQATQAKKNINSGIDSVNGYRLHITEDSINLLREIQSYKWAEDKNGNTLDMPIKSNDHAMDALRYAIFTETASMPKCIATAKRNNNYNSYDNGSNFTSNKIRFNGY